MVIDAYCHCGISKYRPIEDVLGTMKAVGVDSGVLCQHLGEYDNTYLAEVVKAHPGRLAAIGLIDHKQADWRPALDRLVDARAFRGMRITADALRANFVLCTSAVRLGLIPVVDAENGVGEVADFVRLLAAEAAATPIVISHVGYPLVTEDRLVRGREILELRSVQSVHVLLSGLSMFYPYPYRALNELIREVVRQFGAHRVMWGSNYPVCGEVDDIRSDLELVTNGSWGSTDAEITAMTGGTARQVWFS